MTLKRFVVRGASVLSALLTLSGCAVGSTSFHCHTRGGAPNAQCKRLDEVDQLADEGRLGPHQHGASAADQTGRPSKAPAHRPAVPIHRPAHLPYRHPETVLAIWVAPFIDHHDDYHGATWLYRVVNRGYWQPQPVHAVTDQTQRH